MHLRYHAGFLCLMAIVAATTSLSTVSGATTKQPTLHTVPSPHLVVAHRKGVVNFKYLAQHPQPGNHPVLHLPFLSIAHNHRPESGSVQTKVTGTTGSITGTSTTPKALTGSSSPNPVVVTSFPGANLNSEVAALGSDQYGAPPDTQVATSGSDVVEALNSAMWEYSTSGSQLGGVDLNNFFSVPSGYSFTDPKIAYDSAVGRWLLSGLSVDSSNDSQVYLAASTTSDPAGNWNTYTINTESGVLQDQPKIGFDSSVVVISWNDYTGSSSAPSFSGAETWIVNLSNLLSGAALSMEYFGPDSTRFNLVPAISLTSNNTAYAVYNNSCGSSSTGSCTTGVSSVGVVALTGVPPNTVNWSEADPGITTTTVPPPADQPGATGSISTNDDRFLSDVYQNGMLYIAGNDACVPSGDSQVRPCVRLIKVSVSSSPTVTLNTDFGYPGADLYYPSAIPDGNGNVFLSATLSSTSIYPESLGLIVPAGTTSLSGTVLQAGGGTYYWQTGCTMSGFTGCRWGDYSGAAIDPSNPKDVWLASEYAPSNGANWGTSIAEVTAGIAPLAPNVGSITPDTGSTSGGTSVALSGTNFNNVTAVDFGSAAASSFTVNSTTSITATAPPAAASTVGITVTNPYGTSPVTSANQFTYLAPPSSYFPLAPTRILDTRTNGETLNTNGSLNLTVTGGSVPSDATAVALNVTVTNTTAASYLSVYPTGLNQPLVSNLNWTAGETVPNLVIVPIGQNGEITIFNHSGITNVIVDLEGYFAPATTGSGQGSYVPLVPARITDTRPNSGLPNAGATLTPNGSLNVQVAGMGGVPTTGAAAVVLNVTVTNTSQPSYLTVYPQGISRPLASNLNWLTNETVANRVVVPLGSTGMITLYNYAGDTNVVVDVNGYFVASNTAPTNAGFYEPITPTRILDTRQTGTPISAGESLPVQVTGLYGIPTNAVAIASNVTATDTTQASYFTVYPGGTMPLASDVNWSPGQTVPNCTLATLSSSGSFDIYNDQGTADAVVDVFGFFVPA